MKGLLHRMSLAVVAVVAAHALAAVVAVVKGFLFDPPAALTPTAKTVNLTLAGTGGVYPEG